MCDYYWHTGTTNQRRARKQHRCDACEVPIAIGEIYEHGKGILGDSVERFPSQYRIHLQCLEQNRRVSKEYGDCIPLDETWENPEQPGWMKAEDK